MGREMERINVKQLAREYTGKLSKDFDALERTVRFAPAKGIPAEDLVRRFLSERLPKRYGVGQGTVINDRGDQSRQCDVIVYDVLACPIVEYHAEHLFLPVESVYAVIEVKSSLTSNELKKAVTNLESFMAVERQSIVDDAQNLRNRKIGGLFCFTRRDSFATKTPDDVAVAVDKAQSSLAKRVIHLCCVLAWGRWCRAWDLTITTVISRCSIVKQSLR